MRERLVGSDLGHTDPVEQLARSALDVLEGGVVARFGGTDHATTVPGGEGTRPGSPSVRRGMLRVLALVLVALGPTACGDDDDEPAAPSLDEATLTEAWGCGYGSHLSDDEQTVALMIDITDPSAMQTPPQTVDLPDGDWEAKVLVGEHLFSNWCDDVIDGDDPTPDVDETWPVVAGTITMLEDVDALGACERPVAARIEGLVAELPDGTQVQLADREVSNSCWAGGAG